MMFRRDADDRNGSLVKFVEHDGDRSTGQQYHALEAQLRASIDLLIDDGLSTSKARPSGEAGLRQRSTAPD